MNLCERFQINIKINNITFKNLHYNMQNKQDKNRWHTKKQIICCYFFFFLAFAINSIQYHTPLKCNQTYEIYMRSPICCYLNTSHVCKAVVISSWIAANSCTLVANCWFKVNKICFCDSCALKATSNSDCANFAVACKSWFSFCSV